LDPDDGSKVDRKMLGAILRTAVKLAPIAETLAIGEGIETAMAAAEFGFKPAWALGSVGAIALFPVLRGIKRLIILAETGVASERALRICGERWRAAGRAVQVIRPNVGSDLNDDLIHERTSK
jgi:hypothetical protein